MITPCSFSKCSMMMIVLKKTVVTRGCEYPFGDDDDADDDDDNAYDNDVDVYDN
eukprot:m.180315 g.180315  ORF g.180315 m.180315 type:complete len:54 (+) comp32016_c1_seq1:117-278(+)